MSIARLYMPICVCLDVYMPICLDVYMAYMSRHTHVYAQLDI